MKKLQNRNAPIVSVNNLTVKYRTGFFARKRTILKNVSLNLMPGQLVGLTGKNGSGKSTLLKTICGLAPAESGTITVEKKSIGYVPERYAAPLFLTTQQFLWYTGALSNLRGKQCKKRINVLLKQFHLEHYAHAKIATLSKGTAQRLYIAQAIMNKPKLLLLDEPFSGLDETSKKILTASLLEQKKLGTAILCSTHSDNLTLFDFVLNVDSTCKCII